MILVDSRTGSADLCAPLIRMELPAELTRIDADVAFQGQGDSGKPVEIGIELKRLDSGSTDIIQSLRSGRLAGEQLPKMLGPTGAFDYVWVIIEGHWQCDRSGRITVWKGPRLGWQPAPGKMTASELEKQVLTLELCGGVHVRYTNSRKETLQFLNSLYHWWTDTSLDRHTSHLAVYRPAGLFRLSRFREAVMGWPGVGRKLSKAIEDHFEACMRRGVNAATAEWAGITYLDDRGRTRHVGTKLAADLKEFFEKG